MKTKSKTKKASKKAKPVTALQLRDLQARNTPKGGVRFQEGARK